MNFDRFGFKARCKRINCWVYAALHDVPKSCEMRWKCEKGNLTFSPAWVKLDTLCQCTGLRDSDGRLIYENDILEIEALDENQKGQVYYQELDCSFRVWLPLYTTNINTLLSLSEMTGKKVRVIGNKFDKEVEKK